MHPARRAWRITHSHFSRVPAMPMARAPLSMAIWPAIEPAALAAAETSTVSPGRSFARSRSPKYAAMPGAPRTPRAVEAGVWPGCTKRANWPSDTANCCSPASITTMLPTPNTSWRDSITSPTPRAGTTSPDFTDPATGSAAVPIRNGSSPSHSTRHRNVPFEITGRAASTTSKSCGLAGVCLIRIWRLAATERRTPPLASGCFPGRRGSGLGQATAGETQGTGDQKGHTEHRGGSRLDRRYQFTRPVSRRKGSANVWQTVAMPRTARQPPLQGEVRVRRGYFECRFGQLHVHNSMPPGGGFEEGTALICLHGAAASGRVFREFVELVARDRSVYAPDLPGCGESDAPPHAVPAGEYAASIADFLDSVRLRQVDVLGQGAGSVLATELALTRPAQVRRMVLVSVPLASRAAEHAAPTGDLASAALQYPLRERLGRVSQPLLVLRPRDEWWDAAAGVRSALPAARVLDLPEQGADLFRSAPARAAEAVRGFLPV